MTSLFKSIFVDMAKQHLT